MHDEERYADELAAVKAHPTALGLDRRGRLPKIMPADDDRQDLSGTAHYQRALRFSSVLGSYDLAGRSACAPYGCSCAPLTTPWRMRFSGRHVHGTGYATSGTEVVGEAGTFDPLDARPRAAVSRRRAVGVA